MKTFFVVLLALAPAFAFAADCEGSGEAEIIAKVTSSARLTGHSCRVDIAYPRFFQPNQLCELDVQDALVNPIRVEVGSGACPAVGSEISGIVVEQFDGSLTLE